MVKITSTTQKHNELEFLRFLFKWNASVISTKMSSNQEKWSVNYFEAWEITTRQDLISTFNNYNNYNNKNSSKYFTQYYYMSGSKHLHIFT